MKKYHFIFGLSILVICFFSCADSKQKADGYGNFEATEITISAESNGKIMQFNIDEGDKIKKNQFVGYIDTIALSLKRTQLLINRKLISSKSKGVLSQIGVLHAKLKTADINRERAENLIRGNAGTQQQLDNILGEINVLKQQIKSVEIQNSPVVNEYKNIDVQVEQIDDQIKKSKIINPINGTVLSKYVEMGEITSFGKPLYKIADLNVMRMRVYISEKQLPSLKIGQEVDVKIDQANGMKSYKGTISWIASEAEFTPKIIQTKEERVALVYAAKIDVKNDGNLKIGMPAEFWLSKSDKKSN